MNFTQIRHSSHMITFNNKTFAIDPVYADKGTTFALPKGRVKAKNPLVSMPFNTDFIDSLDGVFITHTHFDHFDEAAKELLPKNMVIYCHPADVNTIRKSGFTTVIGINEPITIHDNIKVSTSGGQHGCGIAGKLMGRTTGFIFEDISDDDNTEPTTYIVGDSIWCDALVHTIHTKKPDIVIAFAGEARLPFGKNITMSTNDIHQLAQSSPSSKIIVTHLDTWNHCYLTRHDLRAFLTNKSYKNNVLVPDDGESYNFNKKIQ